jgi:hypothetical protein
MPTALANLLVFVLVALAAEFGRAVEFGAA